MKGNSTEITALHWERKYFRVQVFEREEIRDFGFSDVENLLW
jgi:hypothetical protein